MSTDQLKIPAYKDLIKNNWGKILFLPPTGALIAYIVTLAIPNTYVATTTFIPPQQSQSTLSSALASIGPLAGMISGAAGIKTPADQYVALMQSAKVSNKIIAQFDLRNIYETKYQIDAIEKLQKAVTITSNKKDGIISIEAKDRNPERAAHIANQYVEELKSITKDFAISEAQQRRVFFEIQVQQTKDKLTRAQQTLENSGFNSNTLKSEPKIASENYARIKSEILATEIRLRALKNTYATNSTEISVAVGTLNSLTAELAKIEKPTAITNQSNFVEKYRDFKYQEALFDMYAKQLEIAKIDESKDGGLIQVIDRAVPPEKHSKPNRLAAALGGYFLSLIGTLLLSTRLDRARSSAASLN